MLLDSDVLIISPIKHLFDNNYPYVGEIEPGISVRHHDRVLPYLCYLNTDYILEHNIKYFDEKHTWALDASVKRRFDTGAGLLRNL